MYKLQGVVQHYSWGGTRFISDLVNTDNSDQKPFAEYWLGAHPNAPAQIVNGEVKSLLDAIRQSPEEILGERVQKQFGTLPYLFKILDVRQMLSIQVHPSIESAVKGFAEENGKGIPVNAPHRNYKDENHKPELMAALSGFWLLHGFKNKAGLEMVFSSVPELLFLQESFRRFGYQGLYQEVMTMPQEMVDDVLSPLLKRILPLYKEGKLDKSSEHFWAARAVETFCKNDRFDRGIFSIYLFNLLHLKQGEGIYQPSGLPHAYLEGQNVEVMANSDNVLRAGLTDKHIDVAELMKHVKFEATIPAVIRAESGSLQVYETPAAEFELTRYTVTADNSLTLPGATIFFVYDGEIALASGEDTISLGRGESAVVFANKTVQLKALKAPATLYAVTAPEAKN
jgi:mannose-6-phosphate isomerase